MSEQFVTWADAYPQIAEGAKALIPWPCEHFTTDLGGVSQPIACKGPDDELITTTWRRGPEEPTIVYHSTDGGRSWAKLSEVPAHWEPGKEFFNTCSGCGYLKDGTILVQYLNQFNDGRPYAPSTDESHGCTSYVVRSTDHGKSWSEPVALDPWPSHKVGDLARVCEGPNGMIYLPLGLSLTAEKGKPLTPEQAQSVSMLYVSTDRGKTWRSWASMGMYVCESDILCLNSDRMIAVHRFQRSKLPSDPPDLVSAYYFDDTHRKRSPDCPQCRDPKALGKHSVYKQTAIAFSGDAGRTWTRPRIVTSWVQQTGCIVQLSDGTLILPFSHKDEGMGQRFIVSYDQGQSWSNAIFELHKGGMYANTVAMVDDTLVTIFSREPHTGGNNCLETLRWKAPPKNVASQKGFFEPEAVAVP